MGLILRFLIKKIDKEFKQSINIISFLIIGMAVFYITWTLSPTLDFPQPVYYAIMLIVSVIGSFAITLLHKAIIFTETNLKKAIQILFDFIRLEVPHKFLTQSQMKRYDDCTDEVSRKIAKKL